jgi:hypothetical protein
MRRVVHFTQHRQAKSVVDQGMWQPGDTFSRGFAKLSPTCAGLPRKDL